MGAKNAQRMLGPEGWAPTAEEAFNAGFVYQVVSHNNLMERAQAKAEDWIKDDHVKNLIKINQVDKYKAVNMMESRQLADAFLAMPFIEGQYKFFKSKGKTKAANTFWFLKVTHPLWSRMLR